MRNAWVNVLGGLFCCSVNGFEL